MAITASTVTAEPRSFSLGPWKQQLLTFTAVSGATGGTATANSLKEVIYAVVTGVTQTALPTYSTNVITIAFADPAATIFGQIVAYGR